MSLSIVLHSLKISLLMPRKEEDSLTLSLRSVLLYLNCSREIREATVAKVAMVVADMEEDRAEDTVAVATAVEEAVANPMGEIVDQAAEVAEMVEAVEEETKKLQSLSETSATRLTSVRSNKCSQAKD